MRTFFISTLGFFILSSCAQRLDEFETRLEDVDERTKILESKSGLPVGSDRDLLENRKLADVKTQLSALKNQTTLLQGKLEALEFEAKSNKERIEHLEKEMSSRFQTLEVQTQKSAIDPVEAAYMAALELHQKGDFENSRSQFLNFIKDNSKHHLADNALYWIGQSYMSEAAYRKALVRFQDLIEKFPNSDKRCDAMSLQVEAFRALGMEEEAKAYADVRTKECRKQ